MPKKDPRVDAYIAKSADFAKPILTHVREVVHKNCPDVEETLKWNTPTFMYAGAIMCGMAAFKQHCIFGFWKGSLIRDKSGKPAKVSMGDAERITNVNQLPPDKVLGDYVKQAMKLNEEGIKVERRTKKREALPVPPVLTAALKKNAKARERFEALSPSHRREYVEWITDAKTDETRQRRLDTALEWIAEGKSRNWKYERR